LILNENILFVGARPPRQPKVNDSTRNGIFYATTDSIINPTKPDQKIAID